MELFETRKITLNERLLIKVTILIKLEMDPLWLMFVMRYIACILKKFEHGFVIKKWGPLNHLNF